MDHHNPNFSRLLPFYQREMDYLRKAGEKFSAAYPRVASGLGINPREASDPHVERLLESFAFLVARLQMDLEEQHSVLSHALLDILYPDFVRPFPACSVVQFQSASGLESETVLPRGTSLLVSSESGVVCRFRTTMAVNHWPLQVSHVSYVSAQSYKFEAASLRSPWMIKVDIEATGTMDNGLPDELVFFLGGDNLTSMTLFHWLHAYDVAPERPVFIQSNSASDALTCLPKDAFSSVGFLPEEGLLDQTPLIGAPYRLLWDFFQLPQKFLFFKVQKLRNFLDKNQGKNFSLFFPLGSDADPNKWPVRKKDFRLGCAPVVNLFQKTCEPIHVNHQKSMYKLVADYRLERFTEIHAITQVSSAEDFSDPADIIEPFFSYTHSGQKKKQPAFWVQKRKHTTLAGVKGTDIFLSLLDNKNNLKQLDNQTVYAQTLCTNRSVAEQIPAGASLEVQGIDQSLSARLLLSPTKTFSPFLSGDQQWRLIQHLSLDHLGLSKNASSIQPLKALLALYNKSDSSLGFAIEALQKLDFTQEMDLMPGFEWKTFVPLLKARLCVDEKAVNVQGVLLLSMILNELFSEGSMFNTLVQTEIVTTRGDLIKQWGLKACKGPSI